MYKIELLSFQQKKLLQKAKERYSKDKDIQNKEAIKGKSNK